VPISGSTGAIVTVPVMLTAGILVIAVVPLVIHGLVPWYTVEVVGKFVMAKLVLVIVTLGIVLILTVLVKFVTVIDVGKLSI
jgi:hypothetical protein